MRPTAACRAGLLVLCAALTGNCGNDATRPTPIPCQYTIAPLSLQACMRAELLIAAVTTDAGCTWTATTSASWMQVTTGASGSGTGSVKVAVADNWEAPRTGAVMVRWPGSTTGQDVTVSQAGCLYAVNPDSIGFAAAGGSGTFSVFQMAIPNTCGGALQDACVWSAQSDSTWIVVTSAMPQSGDNEAVRFTVAPNATGATRTGTITVRDKTVRVTQAG